MTQTSSGGPPSVQEQVDWLAQVGAEGAGAFRASAQASVVAFSARLGVLAAIAWGVAAIAGPTSEGAVRVAAAASLGATLALQAAGATYARACSERGRHEVAQGLRRALLTAQLGPGSRPSPQPAEQTAHAAIELVDQVADYHARTQPARRTVGPACVLALVVTAFVYWPVAVILALGTPILAVNMHLAGLATQDASRAQLTQVQALTTHVLDRLRGMRTIVTLGAVQRERATLTVASDAVNKATMGVLRRAFVVSGVLDAVITVAVAVCATFVGLVLLGYLHVGWGQGLTFSSGLFVLLLAPTYFGPLRAYAAGYHEREQALAAAPTLMRLMPAAAGPSDADQTPDVRDLATRATRTEAPSVQARHVSVRFAERPLPVLDDVTLTFPAGRMTAVMAPSGEGKTTLLRVLAGLVQPDAGAVDLVDPVTGVATTARPGQVSWIGQRTIVLPGTVLDNVALGDPTASRGRLVAAAHAVGLDRGLPDGLDTVLGEGGWGISAGQARRVALARAVLRDAPLWILDEPTAHLDAATEAELIATIRSAAAGRTVIVATHSARVADAMDDVVRLHRGVLAADGVLS